MHCFKAITFKNDLFTHRSSKSRVSKLVLFLALLSSASKSSGGIGFLPSFIICTRERPNPFLISDIAGPSSLNAFIIKLSLLFLLLHLLHRYLLSLRSKYRIDRFLCKTRDISEPISLPPNAFQARFRVSNVLLVDKARKKFFTAGNSGFCKF